MECYSDIQVDNLKNYGIIKRVFIYVTERCFMFFLLLTLLLLPCGAVFAMDYQEQRGQNARRVARTLFPGHDQANQMQVLDGLSHTAASISRQPQNSPLYDEQPQMVIRQPRDRDRNSII